MHWLTPSRYKLLECFTRKPLEACEKKLYKGERNEEIFFALLVFLFGLVSVADARPYPVKDIPLDSEKFERIYQEVSNLVYEEDINKTHPWRVEILQTIQSRVYRVRAGERTYLLEIPTEKKYADGEFVDVDARPTGEVYSYTSVTGAKITIPVAEIPERMTKEEFLTRLKTGDSFEITVYTEPVCNVCKGRGKVFNASKRALAKAEKSKCKSCDGTGKTPVHLEVVW